MEGRLFFYIPAPAGREYREAFPLKKGIPGMRIPVPDNP